MDVIATLSSLTQNAAYAINEAAAALGGDKAANDICSSQRQHQRVKSVLAASITAFEGVN